MPPQTARLTQYLGLEPENKKREIDQVIQDYGEAARRARDSGADGIHAIVAGGDLLSQFLSPFYNQRTDEWGDLDEDKYRIVQETIQACRKAINKNMALTVKLSTNDYTPKPGITPELAKKYAEWLAEDGIDGLETQIGNTCLSNMHVWRGDVQSKKP